MWGINEAKVWWKSKTIWFGVAVALLPFLGDLLDVLKDGNAPAWLVSVIGALIFLLRLVTGQPISLTSSTNDRY